MKGNARHIATVALIGLATLASSVAANDIARFADPLPSGGGETMFLLGLSGARLYGGWSGPPRIDLETPLGAFPDCTMWLPPMRVDPNGRVWGGQIVFYMHNQTEVLRIGFTNGLVDSHGFRCGPQTGGTVQFVYSPGGVQVPAGLTEPLQGPSFAFEFHNPIQGPSGPEWTASFTCGATGRKGDLNCDGAVTFADINAFVQAISDPGAYAAAYPWCAEQNADINGDGRIDFQDINAFVALLGA